MGLDVFDITLLFACRNPGDFKEVLNDHHWDILSVIVTKLIIVHEHKQPSRTHQLKLLILIIHTVFMWYHFDERNYRFVVAVEIGFHHALFELPEVKGGSLEVNAVASHSLLGLWLALQSFCFCLLFFAFSNDLFSNFLESRYLIDFHCFSFVSFGFFVVH